MILIVEDDAVTRRALAALLSACGYSTEAVATGEEAMKLVNAGHVPGVALVDLDLPGMNGLEFISQLEEVSPGAFSVLLTAADRDKLDAFRRTQSFIYLRKPVDFKHLLHLIDERPLHN